MHTANIRALNILHSMNFFIFHHPRDLYYRLIFKSPGVRCQSNLDICYRILKDTFIKIKVKFIISYFEILNYCHLKRYFLCKCFYIK